MTTTKKGRKAGSGSFVAVPLGDLNSVLKPSARVIVWGRYAEMLGLKGNPIEAKPDVLIAAAASRAEGGTEVAIINFGPVIPPAPSISEFLNPAPAISMPEVLDGNPPAAPQEDLQLRPIVELQNFL